MKCNRQHVLRKISAVNCVEDVTICGLKEPLNPLNILTFAINAFRDKNFSPESEMSEQEKQMAESIIKLLEQHPLEADLSVEVSLDIEQQDADSTDDERNIDASMSSVRL